MFQDLPGEILRSHAVLGANGQYRDGGEQQEPSREQHENAAAERADQVLAFRRVERTATHGHRGAARRAATGSSCGLLTLCFN